MRFVTVTAETTLTELSHHVFEIRGRNAAERTRQAQAALLQANPHLRDLNKVPAGTLVLVPDLAGTSSLGGLPTARISPEVAACLKQAVAGAKDVLARTASKDAQDAATTLELVKSLGQMSLAKQAPDLHSRLPQIAKLAKSCAKESATLRDAQAQALSALGAELDLMIP